MSRLVDVDKLKDEVGNIFWYEDEDMCKVLDLLDQAPTIEPVKHGKWFIDDDFDSPNFGRYKCSECGEWNHDNYNYCPDCGAKMDGENE